MPKATKVIAAAAETPSTSAKASHQQLLQQLKQIDAEADGGSDDDNADTGGDHHHPSTLRERIAVTCRTLHVKSALAHIGLLVSLSIYCAVGGYVGNMFGEGF